MLASVKASLPGEWKHDSNVGGVWVPPRIGIPDRNRRRISGLLGSIYAEYDRKISLAGYERVCIMTSIGSGELESAHKEWETSKKLQVLHELILFLRIFEAEKFSTGEVGKAVDFTKHIVEIRESCKQLEVNGGMEQLKVAYWKLLFIEPARGVREMLTSVELKIETESVKNALKESIDKGKTSVELEQRIAKLPENVRKDIEDLRSRLLDEQAKQVVMAKEEEAKRERALKRQQQIDQAIKLRKEEIDTGKANPLLQQHLSGDYELKSAVTLWERQYRKELADRKAWEAKRKLEEIELAKKEEARKKELATAEERRKKEAEIAERRKIDEENRIKAKLIRYNVKATVTGYDLRSNPFTYKGQSVIIRLVFGRMMESTAGVFTSGGYQILVSNLPTDLFTGAGQVADLIVKVKGTAEGTNFLGARLDVPHVEYIDILQ
jgi:hypothetical protein